MPAKAKEQAGSNIPRRHSEPTLIPSGDDMNHSELSLDTLSARRKMNRRRSTGSRRTAFDEKQGDSMENAKVLVTWREITTGILLLCAFMTCLSVFFLLGDESQSPDPRESTIGTSNCESRTFLQQQLLPYLTTGEAQQNFSTFQDSHGINGTCSYSFNVCSDNPNLDVTIENLETILYILLVGSLLTVVGVSVLFYDDSEDAMMQLWMAQANISPGHSRTPMTDMSEQTSWGGNASFRRGHNAMADLFPDVSVLFADMVGFEAWSSQREPTQCLTLLETVYDAFDRLAKKQGIFKVEAVADCYTAAAGLPKARSDHAEALLQFAHDCCQCFKETTKALEVTLGPDTSDLSLRVGIHSGPVTALRGGRSRFQLFGEVVTTAQRIMHTSKAGKTQLSPETYQLLPPMLQEEWVTVENPTSMVAKGGEDPVTTYWLTIPLENDQSTHHDEVAQKDDRLPRLVDWNVQLLKRVLNQIAAKRLACNLDLGSRSGSSTPIPVLPVNELAIDQRLRKGKLVIDEVEEVIQLPRYDAAVARAKETLKHEEAVEVSDVVVDQLKEYIETIARSYKANPFHNFEHASHVTMSVTKLLSRILTPKLSSSSSSERGDKQQRIHDHTYGITSDPLTQFACMFSALIHDAEHDGVPNAQLVKEETALAARYKNQSVAEQNSVDVGWNLLMEPRFQDLRNAIYSSEAEMIHFRKLVVNCVMATDICDKQLKELRNNRWERAFATKTTNGGPVTASESRAVLEEDVNRKATIVIEHLLQASDVSHTMQHFNVFRKWNEKLFLEMYFAYKEGRSASDPSKFWYKGEIGFFDFYVIPLAKKLKECGVFGVSSDEYLNYATKNRQEWLSKGQGIVDALVDNAEQAYLQKRDNTGNQSIKIAACA